MPLRLSPALASALERMRTRFGLAFELVTPGLQPWLPAEGGELTRALEQDPATARELATMLATGRTRDVTVAGGSFVLQPLRSSVRPRRLVGLLAVRKTGEPEPPVDGTESQAERWADILRTFIDADLECIEDVRQERQRGRRTWAALRFLGQLTSLSSEAEVARAVVHAAAVWFDVDARLYRRDVAGDLVLHTHLPGVEVASTRLRDSFVQRGRAVRVPADSDDLRWASPEALIVPLSVETASDWVFALGGALPAEADSVFETIAQTMSAHLQRLAAKRRAAVREGFEALLMQSGRALELTLLDALRRLIDETGALSGVISLHENGSIRRLAAFGGLDTEVPALPSQPRYGAERLMHPVSLASGARALIDLRSGSKRQFSENAPLIVREAASVLQLWLAGNLRTLLHPLRESERRPAVDVHAVAPEAGGEAEPESSFVGRIEEELQRARRFDLGLSMLLIDFNAHRTDAGAVSRVIDDVRNELRASDLLGRVGPGRIAVLLVHTDVQGAASVMPRVRRRLKAVLAAVGVPGLRLGRAVMTAEIRTASALLTQASQDVEAIAS